MSKSIQLCIYLFIASFTLAQNVSPTMGDQRLADYEKRKTLLENSIVSQLNFESIGPTIFSGRVTDIDVNPKDPSIFLVAYASGGLWKTENNGTTFTPMFDHEAVMTIGDIAVNWDTKEIWIGTGEVNSSRSSYAGIGIFRSKDMGESWDYLGLPESHHIGRIILHPSQPNVIWVAALGHLYSPNNERGIYRSIDGGKNWEKVLYINENTGAVDLIIDPHNPDILYAATWHRERRAWNFTESGAGSAIYKSINGGTSWNKIVNGFPQGDGVGRIGLAISNNKEDQKIYALLDNYYRREAEEKKEDILTKEDFKNMDSETFENLKETQLSTYLKSNNFPEKYTAKKVKEMVKNKEIEIASLAEYLEDANRLLFDTPVIGAEVYVSEDGGENWRKTHENYLDGVYYSYGYYFGLIRVSPHNPDMIYIAGVPILRSEDGGKTFSSINKENVHVDHHALWLNPDRAGHMINGNDGGINISYDNGENWIKCNSPAVGQFYYINTDYADPYHVYGGTQDNGVWEGSHSYGGGVRWHSSGQYPYKSIMGGDGMQVQIDSRNNEIIYTGFQFGNYFRVNKTTGARKYITPKHDLGERPYRWNWQSPIHLSRHNEDILYMGAHKLFRSMDKGDQFDAISGDLTHGGKKGDVPYGTLTSIHESSLKFGLIYTGSDDGLIHCTQDGGNSWDLISSNLPQDLWVSRVQASSHKISRVYATLNGYRWDDFAAYVFRSEDFGKNWTQIGLDLPAEPVNVIKEDPYDPNLVYIGTDHGVYLSINKGQSFMRFESGLPHAPVHDLVIQEQAQDLLIGTHGRSIYRADITPLKMLNDIKDNEIFVFEIPELRYNENYGKRVNSYLEITVPEIKWLVYSKSEGEIEISIETDEGQWLKQFKMLVTKGINYIEYDLSLDQNKSSKLEKYLSTKDQKIKLSPADNGKIYLLPGSYQINAEKESSQHSQKFIIKERKH